MGLDVYLSYSENWDESLRIISVAEELEDAIYRNKPEGLSVDDFEKWRLQQITEEAEDRGFKVGGDCFETCITNFSARDSEKYPDHYFKIGYFRSSYNGSGINSVMGKLGIPDLYDIFQLDGLPDNYYVQTDWALALAKVNEAIKAYRLFAETGLVALRPSDFSKPVSAAEAIKLTAEQLSEGEKLPEFARSYRSKHGEFYLDGLKVVGIFKNWLVYKLPEPDFWHLHALEIVRETIEFVLSQEHPENWRLRWSA